MNEDTFNMQTRKFLKKVGINAQREIERAVRDGLAAGSLSGDERLATSMTLKIPALGVEFDISDDIALE